MTRIGHLFDESAGWEQRVGVSQLLDRLPSDRFATRLAGTSPGALAALRPVDRLTPVLPGLYGVDFLSAPAVSSFVTRERIDLIHAWGVPAAAAARTLPGVPLAIHLFDPVMARNDIRRLRTIARPNRFTVVCSCETVRRRLVEGGMPRELTVVIRPGVDFALINRWRRGKVRERLGVGRTDRLVIVPEPISRAGEQLHAVYAAAMSGHLSGNLRIILPGKSRERQRIIRLIRSLPVRQPLILPPAEQPFEQLAAVSDVLLVTPRGDMSTTSIAWAMAAETAVIATAVYAVAELIAHRVNGLLFKQVRGRSMAADIRQALDDRTSQQRAKEVARGHAYEAFGLRRYTDQMMRLYDNLLSDRAPDDGITDPAIEH